MPGLKLRELYIRGNAISSLTQLQHLAKLPNLRVLWLQDNPCCNESNYRSTVLQMLPNLRRLDNIGKVKIQFVGSVIVILPLGVASVEKGGSRAETDGGEFLDLARGSEQKVSA